MKVFTPSKCMRTFSKNDLHKIVGFIIKNNVLEEVENTLLQNTLSSISVAGLEFHHVCKENLIAPCSMCYT